VTSHRTEEAQIANAEELTIEVAPQITMGPQPIEAKAEPYPEEVLPQLEEEIPKNTIDEVVPLETEV